jgi:TonB-linked SusC/RagA family outer membrane protein
MQVFAAGKGFLRSGHATQTLRVMKLTAILLTVVFLQANANGYSQTITLSLKDASLKKVFQEITKQTGYNFLYSDQDLQKARTVSLDVKGFALNAVLDLCFKDQLLDYVISENDKLVIVQLKRLSEDGSEKTFIDVKGRVIDEKGEPVAGATVIIKGTKNVTVTDENGFFELKGVGENATLIITSVNHEPLELKLKGQNEIIAQLKIKVTELSNVSVTINTGYQEISKERATGSFTQIGNTLFNQQVSPDILSRLEAVTNGLNVDRVTTKPGIMIRGLSTINGPRDPLIVIDNFPYNGDIKNINPNDVENITVLKDAAATSIYGTKGGNGVIVITTKKAKFNQRLKVDVNTNVMVIDKPDLFYLQPISTTDFINVELFLFTKNFQFSDTANTGRPPFTPVYEILFKRKKGLITAADSAAQIDALRNLDLRNDFNRYIYDKAINQQHYINIQGGSNNMAWISSVGLDKDISELEAKYDRLNLRLENSYKPFNNFLLTTGLLFTRSRNETGKPAYGSLKAGSKNLPVYTQLADGAGNALAVIRDYRQLYLDTAGAGKLLNWNFYPLEDYQHNKTTTISRDLIANLNLGYRFLSILGASVNYQYEVQDGESTTEQDQNSYFTRDLINRFSQLNRSTGVVTYKVPLGAIIDVSNTTLISHSLRGQLDFSKSWKKHSVVSIAGYEIRQVNLKNNRSRSYGVNNDVLTTTNVDLANPYPTFITGANQFIPSNTGFSETMNRFVSYYGNAAYTFDSKYTLSLSGRRDASNLFGVNTNDKWKPLWSSGLSWDVFKESFYKISYLPYLRLRATYGFSGNADPSKSGVTTISYLNNSPYTLGPMAQVNQPGNPELRWEEVRMFNLGVDFKIRNRVTGSVEYYRKKGTDLFGPTQLDRTTGLSSITKNVASMKGSGWDVVVNCMNINRGFIWTTTLNLSLNNDQITNYYVTATRGSNFVSPTPVINALVGKPVYTVFSYKWNGLDPLTGDPQGIINGHSTKDYTNILGDSTRIADLVYNGSVLPKVFGSLGNTFKWKGFSLMAYLLYKFGYYFRKSSINYSALFGNWNGHADFARRWQKPGDEAVTNVPSMIYPAVSNRETFYGGSEINVDKGDHIRLQFITLSYEFNKNKITKLPFQNLQLYLNLNNLGIIWRANKDHLDPDYLINAIPVSKSFAVGLRASFQ